MTPSDLAGIAVEHFREARRLNELRREVRPGNSGSLEIMKECESNVQRLEIDLYKTSALVRDLASLVTELVEAHSASASSEVEALIEERGWPLMDALNPAWRTSKLSKPKPRAKKRAGKRSRK